jgi:hypothetical protein
MSGSATCEVINNSINIYYPFGSDSYYASSIVPFNFIVNAYGLNPI